jgi:hypothetical protein
MSTTVDTQVSMLSQVVARGSLPLVSTAYGSVWEGELQNGVYISTLTGGGGVAAYFYITVNNTVTTLLAGQSTASQGLVGTVLPSAGAAGVIVVSAVGSSLRYSIDVTTGTAGGGATEWRLTRIG